MKLKTSSSNAIALQKDITRFAPAWGLYSVMLALVFYILNSDSETVVWNARNLLNIHPLFTVVNFGYALLTAQLLFGYLFDSRSCNSLHTFPLRRESWFGIHVLAGLLFSLVPNSVFMLLNMLICGNYFYIPLLWLAIETLEYLFFFGLAVLCMLLVGNRFAAVIAYGGLNFLSVLVYLVMEALFVPMMYGVELSEDWFMLLCPMWLLLSGVEPVYITKMEGSYLTVYDPGSWIYLAVLAAIGLVCLGLALVLYRRRDLERAGDFVAENWLRPVFLTVYSLLAGTLLAAFMGQVYGESGLGATIVWILVGMAIGVITGRMLLQRTVKVFDKVTFRSYGALAALMIVILLLFRWDAFGLRRYVPEGENVESAVLEMSGQSALYTEQEDIEKVLALHGYIVDTYKTQPDSRGYLYLTYNMKNGATVRRRYCLTSDLDDTQHPYWDYLKAVTFQPEFILGTDSGVLTELWIQDVTVWDYNGNEDFYVYHSSYQGLMEALLADVEAETLLPQYVDRFYWDNTGGFGLDFQYAVPGTDYSSYYSILVPESAKNTVEFLRSLPEK